MFLIDKSYWEIRKTKSTGRGVFAKRIIEAGSVIGDYIGKRIRESEDTSDKYGMYNLWINFKTIIYADPRTIGIHLLNHNCQANCALYPYKGHMLFFALRKIYPGEELTIQYLINPPDNVEVALMHPCKCGELMCRGTLHGTHMVSRRWGAFLEKEFKKYPQIKNMRYQTNLEPLRKYPFIVPDNQVYDLFPNFSKTPIIRDEKKLPVKSKIRNMIRNEGRIINFKELNLKIYGVYNGILITQVK